MPALTLRNAFLACAVAFLAAGQVLFGVSMPKAGIACECLGAAALLAWLGPRAPRLPFKTWEYLWIPSLMGGTWLLHLHPLAGLFLLALSATLLLPAPGRPDGRLSFESKPMQAWEPWFVGALFLLAAATRFYRLDLYPPGATFPEAMAALRMDELTRSYAPHIQDFHVGWPTLTLYQAYFFAKRMAWGMLPYRIPAATLGTLSCLAFYFLTRRLFSASTAALASVLFTVNNMNLVFSRMFFPSIVLYFSFLAGLFFLLAGLRKGTWPPFVCAGFAVGLSMHSYFNGRLFIVFFLAWLAWLHLGRDENRISRRNALVFLGTFLLVASPVIAWAFKHPDGYWGHVSDMNPNRGKGPFSYIATFFDMLPLYAKMFHLVPDGRLTTDDGLPMIPILGPDALGQALFPLGLFLCLALVWRPLPAFLVAGLLMGALPAMLGTSFPHPTTRRAMMVLPPAFLLAAFGLERIQDWLKARSRILHAVGLGLLALGCAAVAARSVRSYFVTVMGSPEMKMQMNYGCVLAAEEIRCHPGAAVRIGAHLVEPPETDFLLPQDPSRAVIRDPEEALRLAPGKDNLLILDAYMKPLLPFLRGVFPHAVTREELGEKIEKFDGRQDPFYPDIYWISVLVPKADVEVAQGLDLDGKPAGAWGEGFAAAHSGSRLRLSGLLFEESAGQPLRLEMGWPGWSLRVNGRAASWGKAFGAPGRAHFVEMAGRVPAGATGALPLKALEANQLLDPGHWLGLPQAQGLAWTARKNPADFESVAGEAKLILFPGRRIYDPTDFNVPYSLRLDGWLRAPVDGSYAFRFNEGLESALLFVDGKPVFEGPRGSAPLAVALKADRPVRFQARLRIGGNAEARTLFPECLAPGAKDWEALPGAWLKPW